MRCVNLRQSLKDSWGDDNLSQPRTTHTAWLSDNQRQCRKRRWPFNADSKGNDDDSQRHDSNDNDMTTTWQSSTMKVSFNDSTQRQWKPRWQSRAKNEDMTMAANDWQRRKPANQQLWKSIRWNLAMAGNILNHCQSARERRIIALYKSDHHHHL